MPKSISSRPSVEQVNCMLDFMLKHPQLGLGKLKGVYGAAESKKLWLQLTRLLNAATGPNRPVKSWMKFWADKKSMVKAKVSSQGGDPSILMSNMERKIWDGFIACEVNHEEIPLKRSNNFFDDQSTDTDNDEVDNHNPLHMRDLMNDFEERQTHFIKRMVKVIDSQASALRQLATSSAANAQSMNKLADAAQIQALALQGLACSMAAPGGAAPGLRAAVADVDVTLKRLFATMPA